MGEGDCDTDNDCMPGLRCGQSSFGDYCRIKDGHEWDVDTDCCYKPSKYIIDSYQE